MLELLAVLLCFCDDEEVDGAAVACFGGALGDEGCTTALTLPSAELPDAFDDVVTGFEAEGAFEVEAP